MDGLLLNYKPLEEKFLMVAPGETLVKKFEKADRDYVLTEYYFRSDSSELDILLLKDGIILEELLFESEKIKAFRGIEKGSSLSVRVTNQSSSVSASCAVRFLLVEKPKENK